MCPSEYDPGIVTDIRESVDTSSDRGGRRMCTSKDDPDRVGRSVCPSEDDPGMVTATREFMDTLTEGYECVSILG